MNPRTWAVVCVAVLGAGVCLYAVHQYPGHQWLHFFVYLAVILLSSGMKVAMPKSDATMSVNYPLILLGVVQLSPLQAAALVVASVIAQCRFKVMKRFTLVQILFNVANATMATILACLVFHRSMGLVHQQTGPALGIAVAVYFLVNTLLLATVLASEAGTSPLTKWLREFSWYFPFYVAGAGLAAAADYIGNRFGWLTSMLLIPMVYVVYRAYCAQSSIIRDREQHIVEIEELHLRTIEGLAMAIEAKDSNTHRHLMRVRVYVSALGKMLGLDSVQMHALIAASYLHDIGKLAVPEHIINKPGRLTPAEFEKMKIHPVVGAEILERVRFPYPVAPIVRSHHEAWDGSGYPDGLKGEEIPIGARILTAVDYLDALASERPYRKALPLDDAMAMVKAKAGSQLDPQIVRLLEEHYHELETQARQAIDEVPPLSTDFSVERGLSPGAGFELERPNDHSESGSQQGAFPSFAPALSMRNPETLIAAEGRGGARVLLGEREALSQLLLLLIPADCVAIYRRSGATLRTESVFGPCKKAFSSRPIRMGEGLSGWVAEYVLPILNGNPTVEPNLDNLPGTFNGESSALSAPLLDGQGRAVGVITFYSRERAAYSREQLALLQEVGSTLGATLVNADSPQQPADEPLAPVSGSSGYSDFLTPMS